MSKNSDKREVEEVLEILAAYYPGAKHAIHVLLAIQKWAKQLDYPINSLTDLDRQQHKSHVSIDEKHVNLQDITGAIPSYYFPIASCENLIEKVNELYRIKAGQRAPLPPSMPERSFPAGGPPSARRLPPPPPIRGEW